MLRGGSSQNIVLLPTGVKKERGVIFCATRLIEGRVNMRVTRGEPSEIWQQMSLYRFNGERFTPFQYMKIDIFYIHCYTHNTRTKGDVHECKNSELKKQKKYRTR